MDRKKKNATHIQMDDTLRELLEKIDEYIEDESHRYAIAIEGAWGSGKTLFLEQVVREHLKQRKINLIRVSMFGLANADQLYERIGLAILHVATENGRGGIARSAKKMGMSALPSLVSYLDSKGWKFDGSTSMQAIAEFVLAKKKLLVLDDVERRAQQSDEQSLFGAVNNLVEEYGVKVCLVSNSFAGENNIRQFDKDIREKLVWGVYTFRQSPASLARSVFQDVCESAGGIDCLSVICDAVEQVECTNARVMIRVDALIRRFCTLQALRDERIPVQNRKNAFCDAVQMILLIGMGEKIDKDNENASKNEAHSLRDSQRDELCGRYKDFPEIADCFESANSISQAELDNGFRRYLDRYYPDDEAGIALKKIDNVIRSAGYYDDEDMIPYIRKFREVISCGAIRIAQLTDIISIYGNIVSLGFDCGPSREEVISECKRIINSDPEVASNELRDTDIFFGDEVRKGIADELKNYAVGVFSGGLDLSIKSGDDPSMSVDELVTRLSLAKKRSTKLLTETSPSLIANLFASAMAKEQMSIIEFFETFKSTDDWAEDDDLVRSWLQDVCAKVQSTEITSCTGQWRKSMLMRHLKSIEEDLANDNL